MKAILLVASGGAIGSVMRYLVSLWLKPSMATMFPWHTFFVNMVGCAIIGACIAWLSTNKDMQLFVMVGVIGGFTTFSSFGLEAMVMWQAKEFAKALVYILSSNIGGIVAAFAGYGITQLIK